MDLPTLDYGCLVRTIAGSSGVRCTVSMTCQPHAR